MTKKKVYDEDMEMDMEEGEAGTQAVFQEEKSEEEKSLSDGEAQLKRQRMEDEKAHEAASKHYEETMAKVREATPKAEPPPEAPGHEGLAPYRLVQAANIKHQDHAQGDIVFLTHDEYHTLRDVEVHAEAVAQPKEPLP